MAKKISGVKPKPATRVTEAYGKSVKPDMEVTITASNKRVKRGAGAPQSGKGVKVKEKSSTIDNTRADKSKSYKTYNVQRVNFK